MLWSLIGAILFPMLSQKRGASLRGALLGLIPALITGLLLPTKPAATSQMTMVRAEKYFKDYEKPVLYTITTIDSDRRVRTIETTPSDLTVRLTDDGSFGVSNGRKDFAEQWYWMVGLRVPTTCYELQVPSSHMNDFVLAAPHADAPIALDNSQSDGTHSRLAVAK